MAIVHYPQYSNTQIKQWLDALSETQKTTLLEDLIPLLIEAETVSFRDKNLAPYWAETGEPLVKGQQVWPDEFYRT